MKLYVSLTVATVILGLGSFAAPASARSIWDQINESAPRSIWDQLAESAPRTIFDELRDVAPVLAPEKDLVGE